MRTLAIIFLLLTFGTVNAQEKTKKVTTATFTVKGNCEMCKSRIENAADIKGVKVATWDSKTQKITVTYREDKVTEKQIRDAILKSGHDVEDEKAGEDAYKKLPGCCQFRDQKCNH